jgi:hypothetical protein
MGKYICSTCLKEFKQKSHYDKHTNKKNPCINNINKIKDSFQIIINETIENKFNEIMNKKLELPNNKQIKIELNIDNNIIKQSLYNMEQQNKENMIEVNNDQIIQKKGLKRNTIDKYYTKINIVEQCIEAMKKYINISKDDLIIEPSAGNGSFIENIKKITENYKFYDLEPENKEIIKQDFLNFDFVELKQKYKNIHIVGNPPFGRQASLAIKFIKKCCLFSNSISFILPKSFKKDSMKKHFSKNFHLIYEIDLLENSFLVNNVDSDVPCVFQIWQHKNETRNSIIKVNPLYFKFVNKEDNPDISFRRVGVNAGSIMKEINDKSTQSHYFIKFTNNKTIEQNIEKLKLLQFEFNNTVGPKSISKPELINEFNKLLN